MYERELMVPFRRLIRHAIGALTLSPIETGATSRDCSGPLLSFNYKVETWIIVHTENAHESTLKQKKTKIEKKTCH